MAKTSMKIKQQRPAKFSTREYNRCRICGRPHAYLRKYGICRICFQSSLAHRKEIFRGAENVEQIEYKRRIHPHDYERSYCRYAYKNP